MPGAELIYLKGDAMNWTLFFTILAAVESGNNPNKVGDKHLRHPAYGIYQIRQPMLDDVAEWTGNRLVAEKLRDNTGLSRWAIHTYITHWSHRHRQPLTYETAARIHNGGPRGWERDSSLPFWREFEAELSKQERD